MWFRSEDKTCTLKLENSFRLAKLAIGKLDGKLALREEDGGEEKGQPDF